MNVVVFFNHQVLKRLLESRVAITRGVWCCFASCFLTRYKLQEQRAACCCLFTTREMRMVLSQEMVLGQEIR